MGFTLTITQGPGAGQTLRFEQPTVTFGRTADNDVVLYDPNVSRRHFEIAQEDGGWVVRDLGSSNGTRLNGAPVTAHPLSAGDRIEAGEAVFVFTPEEGAPKTAPAASAVPARRRAPGKAASVPTRGAHAPPSGPPAAKGAGRKSKVPAKPPSAASALAKPADPFAGLSARERFKRRKAARTPMGRAKLWYGGLPRQKRMLVNAGAAAIAILLLAVIGKAAVGGGGGGLIRRDYSDTVWELAPDSPVSETTFGYNVPFPHEQAYKRVTVKFRYGDGRATLSYDIGWIDNPDEVEIRLNDEFVLGYAPMAIESWLEAQQVQLPYDKLIQNAENTITFENVKNARQDRGESWAIKNIRVREEVIPAPNPALAKERFELAEKRWSERKISPQNLHDACRYFKDARNYLERLPMKPPLYEEAEARIRECEHELEQTWQTMVFSVQKAARFHDYEKAKGILEQMLKYFPDERDPRHGYIKEYLDKLQ
ncbi:MAG: FHA domain-containing protein [Deltaproteobacteria bacterium]|nr:MAG: FHA domain-containing protein [Deltaproteobacteria bacterium]